MVGPRRSAHRSRRAPGARMGRRAHASGGPDRGRGAARCGLAPAARSPDRDPLWPRPARGHRVVGPGAARVSEPGHHHRGRRRLAKGWRPGPAWRAQRPPNCPGVSDAVYRVRLGLRANWQQFTLLVVINAFVGGMVGLERTVLPLLAEHDFQLTSRTAVLSFIVTFGVTKALANLFAGRMSDRIGRKKILVAGWIVGVPVPLLIMLAPSWGWIIAANILLGINQGLCWSTTVIMKIDLVGPARRGLAMGLNEFAGYVAVSLAALASGYLAATYALRPQPFYLGVAFALLGLLLSIFFVRESAAHARAEAKQLRGGNSLTPSTQPTFRAMFMNVSWKDRALSSASQAGMINNLNDGMAWGLFPLYFAGSGLTLEQVGLLAATYPGVWGVAQLGTGALSDRLWRKRAIVAGRWVPGIEGVLRFMWTAA